MAGRFTEADRAHHEAGHAVVARALGVGVVHVALFATNEDNIASALTIGSAWNARADDVPSRIAAHGKDAKISLAGPRAQHRYRPVKRGSVIKIWSSDIDLARNQASWIVLLEEGTAPEDNAPGKVLGTLDPRQTAEAGRVLQRLWEESEALVEEHWPAIER